MPSAVRSRLTYANVVATLALVFAMSGGALAASHYLITSTKQISPKVLKALKGKPGPAGPAGAPGKEGGTGKAGTNGNNGTAGSNGASVNASEVQVGEPACNELGGSKFTVGGTETFACNGEKGKAGTSVTNTAVSQGNANCEEGGTEFKVGSGGTATFACNGKEGSPWTDKGQLPAGATETGTWSFFYNKVGEEPEERRVPVSFPIPLASPLDASPSHCPSGGECHVHIVGVEQTGTGECEGGTAAAPTAKPGNLCIYVGNIVGAQVNEKFFLNPNGSIAEVGVTGMLFTVLLEGAIGAEGEGYGSWAVTD